MSAESYQFEAITAEGKIEKGSTQAISVDAVFTHITSAGMTPLKIEVCKKNRKLKGKGSRSVSLRDLSVFTYQFSILIKARIPISEGLRSIAEEETNDHLRTIILEVATSINAGSTITDAMMSFESTFGNVYIQSIRAAEESGNLVQVLAHLSEMLEREVEIRSQVRSALLYPISVVVMLCIATVFLLMVVVPRFATMFAARGVELPLPTRMLLGLSGFIMQSWWLIIPLFVFGAIFIRRFRHSKKGSIGLDRMLHRIPIVRQLLQSAALSRFGHVFGISLSSGIGMIDALEMSGRASGRPLLLRDAERMAEQVAQGRSLTDVLSSCPYMTGFVRRLLTAGEHSADLPAMCQIIARHYDRDVRYLAKNMSTLVEPFLVVTLAGVVLFVAIAIFLPMWNMMAVVG